jgi:hypothetical protein
MMRMSTIVRLGALAAAALVAARCSSSSSNPNNPTPTPPPAVTTVVTGVQAADGTQATQQAGSPPAASGGPTITVNASSSVVPGGSEVATLSSAQAFQTVYVSVPNNNGIAPASVFPNTLGPRDATTGFWQLRLAAPVTSAVVISNFAQISTGSRFTLGYSVANATGAVGATVSASRSVVASTGGVQVSVGWNTPTDVDLHVVEPSGNEVYYGATTSSTGGQLDQDSNPACALDNRNTENIRWNNTAPNGTYIVRVDYWSACAVTGSTNFTVTVVNGGQRSTFTGSFTANQADAGGRGSGREITRFNHTTGISPFSMSPVPVEQLSFPSPLKLLMSRQPE